MCTWTHPLNCTRSARLWGARSALRRAARAAWDAGGLQAEAVEGGLAEFEVDLGPGEEGDALDLGIGRMQQVLVGRMDQALHAFVGRLARRAGASRAG